MPLVPEQATSSARPSRRAAKRAIARVGALMEDASDDEAGQSERTRCPRAGRRVTKADVEPVPEAVLRNRVTQRQYLDRKKVLLVEILAFASCRNLHIRTYRYCCFLNAGLQGKLQLAKLTVLSCPLQCQHGNIA